MEYPSSFSVNGGVDVGDKADCSKTDSTASSSLDEELLNQQLIELQTCALLITNTLLQRPEYVHPTMTHTQHAPQ